MSKKIDTQKMKMLCFFSVVFIFFGLQKNETNNKGLTMSKNVKCLPILNYVEIKRRMEHIIYNESFLELIAFRLLGDFIIGNNEVLCLYLIMCVCVCVCCKFTIFVLSNK